MSVPDILHKILNLRTPFQAKNILELLNLLASNDFSVFHTVDFRVFPSQLQAYSVSSL